MVLYRLGTQHLAHDEVGDGTDAHVAPSFVVVMVLAIHQLIGVVGHFVEQGRCLLSRQVGLVDDTQLQLDDAHRSIVDNADELRLDAFVNELLVRRLQRSDSLYLDKDLIGNRRRPQDAPSRTIVLHLVDKHLPALGQHRLKLGFRIFFRLHCAMI